MGASVCQARCWALLQNAAFTAQNEPMERPHSLWVPPPTSAHCTVMLPRRGGGGLSENKWGAVWKGTQGGAWYLRPRERCRCQALGRPEQENGCSNASPHGRGIPVSAPWAWGGGTFSRPDRGCPEAKVW